jgi:3-phenylpropionate/cinnamic acid dioxygenase small subunit
MSGQAIPSAGPDMKHLLDQEVVIEANDETALTGAQRVEPGHVGRIHAAPLASTTLRPGVHSDLQREVEQFLYWQAELLDAKDWQGFIDCFADNGVYWMPSRAHQTNWELEPSIFAEDKPMMEIRKGRVSHPNAWSQAPLWETNHIVSHVAIESADAQTVQVRSRFHMMELRREDIRHFGGRYQHTLQRRADGRLCVTKQRVDLFNAQAPFDYVLQVWV